MSTKERNSNMSIEEKILLSICIPTYNRAEILKKTIESMVSQNVFLQTDKVEIVVSDNVSTDSTEKVMNEFIRKYPDKIRYFRLTTPIDSHLNFENALKKGQGKYVKLLADATCFRPGMLDQFVKDLESADDKDIFITLTTPCYDGEKRVFNSIAGILAYASFNLTWISCYCYKKEVFLSISDAFRFKHLSFPQIDILFRLLKAGHEAVILSRDFYDSQKKKYNTTRNEAHIFGNSYLHVLQYYKTDIPKTLFRKEKHDVLFYHIIPFYFDADHIFFQGNNLGYRVFWKSLPSYHKEPYFLTILPFIIIYYELRKINTISKQIACLKDYLLKIRYKGTPKESFLFESHFTRRKK